MIDEAESWYVRPVFFVTDCEGAFDFYLSLGFIEDWKHEESGKLVAAQVSRAGVELILNQDAEQAGGGLLFFSLESGEVARCEESFKLAGVEMVDEHWGMPVKAVHDADGNRLYFVDDAVLEG